MHQGKLFWNTVTPTLRQALEQLMASEVLSEFRLVGGTALSLQCGHRMSIDIDMFTDAAYGSIDFHAIDMLLGKMFPYVTDAGANIVAMGKGYLVGQNSEENVKLDIYYTTEKFIQPPIITNGLRLATVDEIVAMKVDIVQRGGRKKDFWDLHEVMDIYTPAQMLALHKERHPYTHDEAQIRSNFVEFSTADNDFDPICLRGKYWELIKLDLTRAWA